MARGHDPDMCVTCVELLHLAGFGLPVWAICDQIGINVCALAKHVRARPELAARLSPQMRDEIRHADSAGRHERSSRKQVAA